MMHKQMKMITKKNRTHRAFHALAAMGLASTGSRLNGVYANYLGYSGASGKHWERDAVVRYEVQSGSAKGLSMYGMHRTNKAQGDSNMNQIRLVAEMPISVF